MLEELITQLLGDEPEIKTTRRERRQTKRFHPQDMQNIYQMFNKHLRIIASNKLKKIGYDATEKEINLLIFIWFNELSLGKRS
mgnify:CR=1 FL=1